MNQKLETETRHWLTWSIATAKPTELAGSNALASNQYQATRNQATSNQKPVTSRQFSHLQLFKNAFRDIADDGRRTKPAVTGCWLLANQTAVIKLLKANAF